VKREIKTKEEEKLSYRRLRFGFYLSYLLQYLFSSSGEHDATPRGMFALHRCVVLKEGEKKLRRGKTFYVLALYLHGTCVEALKMKQN
jgi:hypothetical protein